MATKTSHIGLTLQAAGKFTDLHLARLLSAGAALPVRIDRRRLTKMQRESFAKVESVNFTLLT